MTAGKDKLLDHLKFITSIRERIVTFPERNDHFGNNGKVTLKGHIQKYLMCKLVMCFIGGK